ncbi:MAG TPA: hypothetical protein VGH91_11325 [Gammaproteobacteria bacterium]|jgi:hypothetical protein
MRIQAAQQELVERFTALTYPKQDFHHPQHLELAWTLLADRPLLEAMQEFRRLLQAFAEKHQAQGLYNETITCFYLLLIRERMDGLDPDHDWQAFHVANPDLFSSPKAFLERWYPQGAAFQSDARQNFRLPA